MPSGERRGDRAAGRVGLVHVEERHPAAEFAPRMHDERVDGAGLVDVLQPGDVLRPQAPREGAPGSAAGCPALT